MKVAVECGQRWWRRSSWRRPCRMRRHQCDHPFWWRPLMVSDPREKFDLRIGTAIGPIMFFNSKEKRYR